MPPSETSQRGFSTVFTVLLVVLVAGGLGAGSYFGYNWWQRQAKQDTRQTAQPTPPADPRVGWKTYTDSENGFSLKYPPDWTTKEGTFPSDHGKTLKDVSFSGTTDKVFVTVRENPDADLEAFVKADSVTGIQTAKVDTLDGFAATTTGSYRVYLGKAAKVYMFTFPGATTNSDLSTEQVNILTSFQFTSGSSGTPSPSPSSSTVDTANWKTYTSEQHGYSIKYSPDWKVVTYVSEEVYFGKEVDNDTAEVELSPAVTVAVEKGKKMAAAIESAKQEEECPEDKQATVAGLSARRLVCVSSFDGNEYPIYYVEKGNNLYSIFLSGGKESESTFEAMVKSFKFTS